MNSGRPTYRFNARSGFEDFMAQALDKQPEQASPIVIVLDDQYFICYPAHKIRTSHNQCHFGPAALEPGNWTKMRNISTSKGLRGS
jgi:hypothetical protein